MADVERTEGGKSTATRRDFGLREFVGTLNHPNSPTQQFLTSNSHRASHGGGLDGH